MNEVHKFWEKQAGNFGTADTATAPDHHYRLLEIEQIINCLPGSRTILDVGCGNGYSTLKFRESQPNSDFCGIDYSPQMIEEANKSKGYLDRVTFDVGNVLKLEFETDTFDCAISTRCLINLSGWDEQKQAILELKRVVRPGGKLLIVENTIEGLAGLNHVRKRFGLPAIKQRWHNRYLSQFNFTRFVGDNGLFIVREQNIGNTYYLVSRVLHAKLAALEGVDPAYDHILNELAAMLPTTPHYHYSPNVMWVLKKS